MTIINLRDEAASGQIAQLREKLAEAEEILQAIRNGSVDALVVSGPQGDQIYTLKGADQIYRVLIESMTEGAVILAEDGTILYGNGRFAEMMQTPIANVTGESASSFFADVEKNRFAGLLKRAWVENVREEARIQPKSGDEMPVLLSMRSLVTDGMKFVSMLVTDLTQQQQLQHELKSYAENLRQQNLELSRRTEQLCRLSAELTQSEQRERRRVAKLLHDHLQQLLVCARFGLETFAQNVAPEQRRPLEEIVAILIESLDASRSLTTQLYPPILLEGGLVKALVWLCSWMKEKHGLGVELTADPHAVLNDENMIVLLFEAIRELLFNVVKHARVNSARVQILCEAPQSVKIVVSDQGPGFDAKKLLEDACLSGDGFGLFSIRERLSLLGGGFEMESVPGQGTVISLTAPLGKGKVFNCV